MSYSIHQLPGRLRVRSPALRNRADLAQAVVASLRSIVGVRQVHVKAAVGSVLVHYDCARTSPATLIDTLAMLGVLEGIIGFPGPLRRMPRTRDNETIPRLVALARSEMARKGLTKIARLCLPMLIEKLVGKTGAKIISAVL